MSLPVGPTSSAAIRPVSPGPAASSRIVCPGCGLDVIDRATWTRSRCDACIDVALALPAGGGAAPALARAVRDIRQVRVPRRSSLPDAVRCERGDELDRLGHLEARAAARAERRRSSASVPRRRPACSTTRAAIDSPHCGSARPSTSASATAGWASSTASTSVGATFSPPVTIVSARRPVTVRRPRASSAPRSPVRSTGPACGATRRRAHADLAVLDPHARAEERRPGVGLRSPGRAVVTCEHASVSP